SRFPQDLAVYFDAVYQAKKPFVALTWLTPDGRTFELGGFSVVSGQSYVISDNLPRKYLEAAKVRLPDFMRGEGGFPAAQILFASPASAASPSVGESPSPGASPSAGPSPS